MGKDNAKRKSAAQRKSGEQVPERKENLGPPATVPVEVRWPLNIIKAERTVFELYRRWRANTLRLAPEFQREFVWSQEKQVRLIESVMARIPLPVFYLSEEMDGDLLVVDGQQRLTTLFAFMEGRFADANERSPLRRREDPSGGHPFVLRNLCLLKELEGKEFATLDAKGKRRFEETTLTCFITQPGTDEAAKFELFERINEGAAPLVAQEIRNALYRGKGLDLVKRLAAPTGRFREVAGPTRSYAHMRADELVLRAITFLWRGWKDYKGDIKLYLNDTLQRLNTSPAELDRIEERFLHSVEVVDRVFRGHAWQRWAENNWDKDLSGPLVEAMCTGIDRAFPVGVFPTERQAAHLEAEFKKLCAEPSFSEAILTATQTAKNVEIRMTRFEEVARSAAQIQP